MRWVVIVCVFVVSGVLVLGVDFWVVVDLV